MKMKKATPPKKNKKEKKKSVASLTYATIGPSNDHMLATQISAMQNLECCATGIKLLSEIHCRVLDLFCEGKPRISVGCLLVDVTAHSK